MKAGQVLMEIDPRLQIATVESARATERQKKALYDYNAVEVERQRKLFEAGVTSRDAYDQAQQSFGNTKADYESAVELRKTQEEQLAYYTIRAPFDGVVGDIPVHVGDFASPLNSPPTRADHGGREQGSRSLHLRSHGARQPGAAGAGCGADGQRRQAAGKDQDRFSLAAGG